MKTVLAIIGFFVILPYFIGVLGFIFKLFFIGAMVITR
jgi:hypothetical protein